MNIPWHELIPRIHASGVQAVLAVTGGGSGAIAELLRVPGGSRLVLEAIVPYAERSLTEFLGAEPKQACSVETAVEMAERARARAATLAPGTRVIGLGATASLVSDRPKQGEHRAHIAFATTDGTDTCSIGLAKARRARPGEEDLVARAIVLWLAKGCGIDAPSPRSLFDPDERYAETTTRTDLLDRLLSGAIDRMTALPDGQLVASAPTPRVVLPGSFNPVHDGHLRLARVAEEMLHEPVAFEISVTNVDKRPLDVSDVKTRVAQFAGRASVELTRAPTFLEKSRLFPGVAFVIGADTAERLVATRYYGDEAQMFAALQEITDRGSRFLVAVRVNAAGRVLSLADIAIPSRFANLFTPIPESRFRLDASSSDIRAARRAVP